MHLESLFSYVLPKLSYTGSSEQLKGIYELESIDVGRRHFDLAGGIAYDATLVNTGEAILLSGTATTEVKTSCDRCLEPTELTITGEVQGYFLFDPASIKDGESAEEYETVDRDGRIDVAPPVLAAIVIELPAVTLCRPDCDGIAPPADAQGALEDFEQVSKADSPFAALKDLKLEE